MAKGKGKKKVGAGDVASNRYASYRYELLERIECGIVLEGTEVKALRTSGAQLKDGYAALRDGELWLHSVHIPPYGPASRENHDPERPRKLLLHRRELTGSRSASTSAADAGAHPDLLPGLPREGRDRPGPWQGPLRQAPDHPPARDAAGDRTGACAKPSAEGAHPKRIDGTPGTVAGSSCEGSGRGTGLRRRSARRDRFGRRGTQGHVRRSARRGR